MSTPLVKYGDLLKALEHAGNEIAGLTAERDEAVRQHQQTLEAYRNSVAERDEARIIAEDWKRAVVAFDAKGIATEARAQAFAECEDFLRAEAQREGNDDTAYTLESAADAIRARAALSARPGAVESACLRGLASNEPCHPDGTLKRCTLCGFIVDTKYTAP